MVTKAELEAGKTAKGGYTKTQLAAWGVPYPPPHGWPARLLAGEAFPPIEMSGARPSVSANDLLRQVVSAIISAGHADDLYDFPDVLEYFGSRIPSEEETADHWKGRKDT